MIELRFINCKFAAADRLIAVPQGREESPDTIG